MPLGLTYSPVKGPEGNIEYLVYLANFPTDINVTIETIEEVVKEAHANAV
jgi:23S rRNA (cytidine1920-2'-O)/16S rRNA (cytidine1409-2'-O)-methyltransferase